MSVLATGLVSALQCLMQLLSLRCSAISDTASSSTSSPSSLHNSLGLVLPVYVGSSSSSQQVWSSCRISLLALCSTLYMTRTTERWMASHEIVTMSWPLSQGSFSSSPASSSWFSWMLWTMPNIVPLNQLFGVHSDLGMSTLTFHWMQISWIGSLLMVPWWVECHVFAGALQAFTMYFSIICLFP